MKLKDLEDLGLLEKDARVYMALLEMRGGTALEISRKADLPKSTTHDTLKSLVGRDLATSSRKKNKIIFTPGDPELLASRIESQHKTLERVLPELELFYWGPQEDKPKVRFYQNRKGIEVAIKEMAEEAKEVMFLSSWVSTHTALPEYFPKVAEDRVRRGIRARALVTQGVDIGKLRAQDPEMLRETRVLPIESPMKADLWLWKNKAILHDIKGRPNAIFIEDENMVSLLASMFEMLWVAAPQNNKLK